MNIKPIHSSCGYVYQEIRYYSDLSRKLSILYSYSEVNETIDKFVFCYNWTNQIIEQIRGRNYDYY